MKSEPQPVTLQIESVPPGAVVKTSLGGSCTAPCALPITPDATFTATYELKGYKSETVSLDVAKIDGQTRIDPNPLMVELEALPPPPKRRAPTAKKPAAAKKPVAARPAAASTAPAPRQPGFEPAAAPEGAASDWPAIPR